MEESSSILVNGMQFSYDIHTSIFFDFTINISSGSRCLLVGSNGSVEGVDPIRREKLIELLDIDLNWRMHKVSDGQRRRVQICMGLLHPFKVLLLDEVTVDLDIVARMDLLDFFKEECEQRGATIVYATHIFDGLETWASDIVYIQEGMLKRHEKLSELSDLKCSPNLLSVVESWLRSETKTEKKKQVNSPAQVQKSSPFDASPFRSSRHMAYYR